MSCAPTPSAAPGVAASAGPEQAGNSPLVFLALHQQLRPRVLSWGPGPCCSPRPSPSHCLFSPPQTLSWAFSSCSSAPLCIPQGRLCSPDLSACPMASCSLSQSICHVVHLNVFLYNCLSSPVDSDFCEVTGRSDSVHYYILSPRLCAWNI